MRGFLRGRRAAVFPLFTVEFCASFRGKSSFLRALGAVSWVNHDWQGARDQATLWPIASHGDDDDATIHGTQKPVECMLRPILNNSVRGDAVYEPFAGSGTTIIAAERSGRRCLAMELDPGYCDVIIKRWQVATGRYATLEGDGRIFAEVAQEQRLVRAA